MEDKMEDSKYEIPREYLGGKRENVSSWDDTFMKLACVTAERSKDPSSQVGACLVDSENYILSLGYNGAPNGWPDSDFPWGRDNENPIYNKYSYVVHAEENAIYNFKGDSSRLRGATVYVTLFPCPKCAKALIQNGVSKVVYLSDKYANTPDVIASKILLRQCKVKFEQFDEKLQREVTISLIPPEKQKVKQLKTGN